MKDSRTGIGGVRGPCIALAMTCCGGSGQYNLPGPPPVGGDDSGQCSAVCPEGDLCVGTCVLFCAGGTTRCGSVCTVLRDDPANCGACGVECGAGAACVNGRCAPLAIGPVGPPGPEAGLDQGLDASPVTEGEPEASASPPGCDAGLSLCNGECVDTSGDRNNCSACGAACGSGRCSGGACVCTSNATLCGSACVDTAIAMSSCGTCGSWCADGHVCTKGTCAAATSDWPMFGHGPEHSGANDDETGAPPVVDEWSVVIALGDSSSPDNVALSPAVVEDGRVFVTSSTYFTTNTSIVAVHVADGSPLWTYNFGRVSSVGHPSVSNGTVYVQTVGASEDCYLWAIDALTASVTWTTPFESQWATLWAPMTYGGTVYIDGGDEGLYAFSTTDGSQIFNDAFLGGGYDSWSPAYFNGSLYTFVAGTYQAEDPTTGAATWSMMTSWNWDGYSMNTSPVFGSSLGFVVTPPNLVAIDLSKHAAAWTANAAYTGTPAVSNGVVYGTSGGSLVARDEATGNLLWTFVGDQSLSYPPVVANGYVYVSSSANVYAVNIATHAQAWTAAAGGWVTVAAGRLLVAGTDGTLRGYVLSTP